MTEVFEVDVASVDRAVKNLAGVREEIEKVIVGQIDVIEGVLICLIAEAMSYWKVCRAWERPPCCVRSRT